MVDNAGFCFMKWIFTVFKKKKKKFASVVNGKNELVLDVKMFHEMEL